jgi:hypothetical protein
MTKENQKMDDTSVKWLIENRKWLRHVGRACRVDQLVRGCFGSPGVDRLGARVRSARGDTRGLCPARGWLVEPIRSVASTRAWVDAHGLGPTQEHARVSWCDWLGRLGSWLVWVMDQWVHHPIWCIICVCIYISWQLIWEWGRRSYLLKI